MGKLWVYGCSFSCNFQDLHYLPQIPVDKGWPGILSKNLGLKLVDRALPGYGWNHIVAQLDDDLVNNRINKEDLIILSPSYFQRLTFPELQDNKIVFDRKEGAGDWVGLTARYSKSHAEVVSLNIKRFYYKIKTLKELGYNIFGWCWTPEKDRYIPCTNKYLLEIQDYLIPTPDNTLFWEDWILQNPKCMLIPGKPLLPGNGFEGDTHFSQYGHKIAAEHFFSYLSNIY